MVSDKTELNAKAARALMSLIKITEALEDDGCIVSTGGSVSKALIPEIMAVAAAKADCDENAVRQAVFSIVGIRDEKNREALIDAVLNEAEAMTASGEEPGALLILREFDLRVRDKDKDFYANRGGADIGLSDMYEETVNAITTIMLKG